jgi:hypothetical protein
VGAGAVGLKVLNFSINGGVEMSDKYASASRLSEHKIKKGKVIAPFNYNFGDKLELSSWFTNRMPEYIWLALILSKYGREEGFKRAGQIIFALSRLENTLQRPKLSSIFALPSDKRNEIYEMICTFIDPSVLAPLTIIYRNEIYQDFTKFFYDSSITVEERIEILKDLIEKYGPHQTNEATDLRYLALALQLFNGKMNFTEGVSVAINAFREYPTTPHEDEKMRMYRPSIRSMEGFDMEGTNLPYIDFFWRELGSIVECNLMYIDFKEDYDKPLEYIEDTEKIIKYLVLSNKEKTLFDSKFEVIVGSTIYALKVLKEIVENNLNNKILGRHAIRTIIEVYIMLKYLLKRESEKPDIWYEYQLYGISKYKLILLKARENLAKISETNHHLALPVIDGIVNEKLGEEFIDIDLRYFDQQGIREKAVFVDEKELYDFYYDYDSNFAHGLWGAVRESAMLFCDNSTHKYHSVPDYDFNQNLISVQSDGIMIMKKVVWLLSSLYELPSWYSEKYEVNKL